MKRWIFLHTKLILGSVFVLALISTVGSTPVVYALGMTTTIWVLLGGWKYYSVGWKIEKLQKEAEDYQKESKPPEPIPILRGKGSKDDLRDEDINHFFKKDDK